MEQGHLKSIKFKELSGFIIIRCVPSDCDKIADKGGLIAGGGVYYLAENGYLA